MYVLKMGIKRFFPTARTIVFVLLALQVSSATADSLDDYVVRTFFDENGNEIEEIIVPGRPPDDHREPAVEVPLPDPERGINVLGNVPAFDWCYGCSPTSAAMMAGYYDRTDFADMYTGPTNGGVVPMNNGTWGYGECPLSATHQGYDGLSSRGHADDYWDSYGSSNDPYYGNWTEHGYADCTADYMGTNQYHNWLNTDGASSLYSYSNGNPLYDYTGCEPEKRDLCHGFRLFFESRGYAIENLGNFNQRIYGYEGNTNGFTYEQFKAEIDAGRPVMIQVVGHSMVGYGYNDSGNTIYIHDTWDHNNHSMAWGGSYSGMTHHGVSVFRLQTPPPPLPPEIERVNPTTSSVSIVEGTSIDFLVNVSDVNGDLSHIHWSVNGTIIVSQGVSGYNDTGNHSRSFGTPGTVSIKARVYDDANAWDELSWSVEVTPSNVAPEIHRLNPPAESITIQQWESVDYEAYATDADGNLDRFTWYLNGSLMETTSASSGVDTDTWSYSFNQTGSNTVTVYIFDDEDLSDNLSWEVTVNEATGSEIIQVTEPASGDTLVHFQTNTVVLWNYPATLAYDSVKIDIYENDTFLDTFTSWTENDGTFTRTEPIPNDWGTGSNYQMRVTDNLGNFGYSEYFTIEPSTGQQVITVTEPDDETVWTHFETALPVNWQYPAMRGASPLSGDSVCIEIFSGDSLLAALAESIPNTGSWVTTEPVPKSWEPDTDYRIRVTDNLGNFGYSEYFAIEPSTGQQVITITEPDDETTWYHLEPNMLVSWDYPANRQSTSIVRPLSGDSVTIDLYAEGLLVETLAQSVPNTGNWIMSNPVSTSWYPDSTYQVKITDNFNNFGWSSVFEIVSPVSVSDDYEEIYMFNLEMVAPNPSTGNFTVSFSTATECMVNICIYNIFGRLVQNVTSQNLSAGPHSNTVQGLDPGIYFCRMQAGEFSKTRRLVVIE